MKVYTLNLATKIKSLQDKTTHYVNCNYWFNKNTTQFWYNMLMTKSFLGFFKLVIRREVPILSPGNWRRWGELKIGCGDWWGLGFRKHINIQDYLILIELSKSGVATGQLTSHQRSDTGNQLYQPRFDPGCLTVWKLVLTSIGWPPNWREKTNG